MKNIMYRQCALTKKTPQGIKRLVSWIPDRFSVPGKYLEVNGENGWLVESATGVAPESLLVPRSHEWTQHRRTTDI